MKHSRAFLRAMRKFARQVDGKHIESITISSSNQSVTLDKAAAKRMITNINAELKEGRRD